MKYLFLDDNLFVCNRYKYSTIGDKSNAFLEGTYASSFAAGIWNTINNTVELTVGKRIPSETPISFVIVAKTGLLAPRNGVLSQSKNVKFSIASLLVPQVIFGETSFADVSAIGISTVSVTVAPLVQILKLLFISPSIPDFHTRIFLW